jgi:3-dehydroquinate synthase
VERILAEARRAGLGRDGLFIGIGGGVVGDLTAFAASVYMRGGRLCLIPTTLLGMVDAALGGKTGFDLLGVKNLVGTFYPADHIFMSIAALASLPGREWKSGMAELIKTAVLDTGGMFKLLESLGGVSFFQGHPDSGVILELIARSTAVKGRIVQADPRETGTERALLNLGHTFGHALESAVGLGVLSHGEAVAWGMVRACELGLVRGITPPDRAAEIAGLIGSFGYETAAPHPLLKDAGAFFDALGADKKKKGGKLTLVVPAAQGAVLLPDFSLEDAGIAGLVNGDHGV